MDENRKLLILDCEGERIDCEGERRKKGSKPFGKKGRGINWFFEKGV